MLQPASGESNSFVKRRGSGVGEDSIVAVGAGVSVKGTEVGEGGIVEVGGMVGAGVVAADWQAVMRINPRRRSFFMAFIKTQLPAALFQAIVYLKRQMRSESQTCQAQA